MTVQLAIGLSVLAVLMYVCVNHRLKQLKRNNQKWKKLR